MNTSSSLSQKQLYFRLLRYVKPYWKAFALAMFTMVCTSATEPVFPAIMKYLLDNGFRTQEADLVWLIPVGIVSLFIVRGIVSFCTNYLMTWISSHVITDIRREMFNKMLKLPTQIFHENSAGKLMSRILGDTGHLTDSVTTVLVVAARESLTAIALFAYLIYLDWKLTLVTLIIGPLVAVIVKGFGRRMRIASKATLESTRHLFHSIEESASAHKVVKIYGAQNQQRQRFFNASEKVRRSQMKEAVPSAAITPITHIAASVAVAIIIYLALSQTTGQASVSAGGFISFITALLMLISPIKQLTSISSTLNRGLVASESVFAFLDMPVEEDSGKRELAQTSGKIEFDHVRFSYPGAEALALNDISFQASSGQVVALVGASGGGKTTVSTLIPRFYRPTEGRILIDDIDINELTLTSLRHHISLVSQEIVLFNDTVEANIAFGMHESTSREQVVAAAKAANAWDFISQLPEGLDTYIGEDGSRLSGGQRQRIAIARAILKNAPILILDEATSALDTESERQVQSALATLMKNRTTLVIAHRLSTIEHADQILVLDRGRIVERGTHTELVAMGGYYANLNRVQDQKS